MQKLSAKAATQWGVVPLGRNENGVLQMASLQDANLELLENLRAFFGEPVEISTVLDESALRTAIE